MGGESSRALDKIFFPIKFVTDQNGEKTSVILPIAEYEELLEDLDDLAVIAMRANDPTIPFDEAVAHLKRDGLL
jgi:hypothetical protein